MEEQQPKNRRTWLCHAAWCTWFQWRGKEEEEGRRNLPSFLVKVCVSLRRFSRPTHRRSRLQQGGKGKKPSCATIIIIMHPRHITVLEAMLSEWPRANSLLSRSDVRSSSKDSMASIPPPPLYFFSSHTDVGHWRKVKCLLLLLPPSAAATELDWNEERWWLAWQRRNEGRIF